MLPLQAIGHVLAYLCGPSTCKNFLEACIGHYGVETLREYVWPIQLLYGYHGMGWAPISTFKYYMEIPAKKDMRIIRKYLARGLSIDEIYKYKRRLLKTNSTEVIQFLRDQDPEFRLYGTISELNEHNIELADVWKVISPNIIPHSITRCKDIEVFRRVFYKIPFLLHHANAVIQSFLSANNIVGLKFLHDELGHLNEKIPYYCLTKCNIDTLKLLLEVFKIGIINKTFLISNYFEMGKEEEFSYLCVKFSRDPFHFCRFYSPYPDFSKNCTMEFFTFVRNNSDVKKFDRLMVDKTPVIGDISAEKYHKFKELGYFEEIDNYKLASEAGYYNNTIILDQTNADVFLIGLLSNPAHKNLTYEFYEKHDKPHLGTTAINLIMRNGCEKLVNKVSLIPDQVMYGGCKRMTMAIEGGNYYAVRKLLDVPGIDLHEVKKKVLNTSMPILTVESFALRNYIYSIGTKSERDLSGEATKIE